MGGVLVSLWLVKSTTELFKSFARCSQLNLRKSVIIDTHPETEFQGTPFIKLPKSH